MKEKRFSKKFLLKKSSNIIWTFSLVALACSFCILPANSQQIITDGNTTTNLAISGTKTTVTTSTIQGKKCF